MSEFVRLDLNKNAGLQNAPSIRKVELINGDKGDIIQEFEKGFLFRSETKAVYTVLEKEIK